MSFSSEVKVMGVNVSLTDLGGELGEKKSGFRPRSECVRTARVLVLRAVGGYCFCQI